MIILSLFCYLRRLSYRNLCRNSKFFRVILFLKKIIALFGWHSSFFHFTIVLSNLKVYLKMLTQFCGWKCEEPHLVVESVKNHILFAADTSRFLVEYLCRKMVQITTLWFLHARRRNACRAAKCNAVVNKLTASNI